MEQSIQQTIGIGRNGGVAGLEADRVGRQRLFERALAMPCVKRFPARQNRKMRGKSKILRQGDGEDLFDIGQGAIMIGGAIKGQAVSRQARSTLFKSAHRLQQCAGDRLYSSNPKPAIRSPSLTVNASVTPCVPNLRCACAMISSRTVWVGTTPAIVTPCPRRAYGEAVRDIRQRFVVNVRHSRLWLGDLQIDGNGPKIGRIQQILDLLELRDTVRTVIAQVPGNAELVFDQHDLSTRQIGQQVGGQIHHLWNIMRRATRRFDTRS